MYSCVLFEADSEMEVAHNRSSNTVIISQARCGRPAISWQSTCNGGVRQVTVALTAERRDALGAMSYFTHANLGTRVRVKRCLHGHPSDLLVD